MEEEITYSIDEEIARPSAPRARPPQPSPPRLRSGYPRRLPPTAELGMVEVPCELEDPHKDEAKDHSRASGSHPTMPVPVNVGDDLECNIGNQTSAGHKNPDIVYARRCESTNK